MMLRRCAFVLLLVVAGCGQPASTPPPPSAAAEIDSAALAAITAREEAERSEVMAAIAKLPAPYNEGDYDNGKKVFKQCEACHLIKAGAGNSIGPNLHGVFGRKAGTLKDYDYSDSVKNSGITWSTATLEQWLQQPATFVPNTRMTFLGVKKPEDRRDVIAYIEIEQAR